MLPVWPYTVQFLQLFKVVVREGYTGHLFPIEARCLIASPLLPKSLPLCLFLSPFCLSEF